MQTKRIVSFLLLLVFTLYITPKEVYHAFTHHTDTIHHSSCSKDGLQISNEHHHCELLKMDQEFSVHKIALSGFNFSSKQLFFVLTQKDVSEIILPCNVFSFKQLRAPPVFVA